MANLEKLLHYCRNRHCRSKLKIPVENEHHAFCIPGCHRNFYHSRCLVCEDRIRRKNKQQRFGSGHVICKAKYRRFPHAYDFPRYYAHFTGLRIGDSCERGSSFWRGGNGRGWYWESQRDWDEIRLLGRGGEVLAQLWPVGERWYLLKPKTIPLQWASEAEAAKRLALSIALAALPLDPATAPRVDRLNTSALPLLKRYERPTTFNFRITEAKLPGDAGELPPFLQRAILIQ